MTFSIVSELRMHVMQGQLNKIKLNQQKLLTAHEMSKSITRAEEMKAVREKMQVLAAAHASAQCHHMRL